MYACIYFNIKVFICNSLFDAGNWIYWYFLQLIFDKVDALSLKAFSIGYKNYNIIRKVNLISLFYFET